MKDNNKSEDFRCSFVNLGSNYGDDSIVHANYDQNSSFDRKLDNSLDISHSMNIINLNSNHYPQFNSSVLKENFEDMPLQITSLERIKVKSVIPHLIIEDKGERKDYLNAYRIYEITEINEKNEKKILCYRRYNNFDMFYNRIKKKYPFYLIPKLIGKNPLNKFMNIDDEFYNKRRRQLNYFLNYIYNHPKLKNCKEFLKFVKDPECDEEFFLAEEIVYDFPEASNLTNGITQKFLGMFTNYFTVKEENININEKDRNIKIMEVFYRNTYDQLKEIKNQMSNYMNQLKKTGENYESLANNFMYMKDVTFDTQITKDYMKNYSILTSELGKINKLHYEDTAIDLEEKFEGFISVLSGLCDIFERYNEFLKHFSIVNRAIVDSKTNTRFYDKHKLNQEERKVKELKTEFEDNLYNEVKEFKTKYHNIFGDIVENYKLMIKSINSREISKLQCLIELN